MSNILTKLAGAKSSFQSAMSLLTSSLSVDVVRITDSAGRQVFAMARIIKAGVSNESEFFQHPLEDGNKTTDFKIDKPIVIQLGILIPTDTYQSVYASLVDAKKNGEQFIIQTRAGSFANMVIKSMPHEEGEFGDCLAMALTFEEVKWYKTNVETLPAKEVAASKKKVGAGAKQDADTSKLGQKRASDVSASTKNRADSIVYGWIHK